MWAPVLVLNVIFSVLSFYILKLYTVYVVCVNMCVHMQVHVYMETRGQTWLLFLGCCLPCFCSDPNSTCLGIHQVSWLADEPQRVAYLCLLNIEITSTYHHAWHFYMDSEDQTQISVSTVLTKLSPNPTLQHLEIGLIKS